MSYERAPGLGATLSIKPTITTTTLRTPGIAPSVVAPGSPLRSILVIGALGIGGYLLYRRFKKGHTSPTPPAAP